MQELFHQFGLSPKESSAFLILVRLGACPISLWAKHAKINRSSMYVLLERLKGLDLVTTFFHRGIQHVQAISMAELPTLINQKQEQLESTRSKLTRLLPQLKELERTSSITPTVRFYEGVRRVEHMYEEVLAEKSFRAFFNPGRVKAFMPEYFHKIPLTLKQNGGTAKELLVNCRDAKEYQLLYNSPKHAIKLLPDTVTFSSDTIITKTKIYLIGYSEKDAVGTEIWNSELAQTQSSLFDMVWDNRS